MRRHLCAASNQIPSHAAGDVLLMRVAKRLQQAVRPRDGLGRFGGDEFVVVLEDVSKQKASLTARRIKDVLTDGYTVAGNKFDIGASVGIAANEGAVSAQKLINRADRSMYKAKRQN